MDKNLLIKCKKEDENDNMKLKIKKCYNDDFPVTNLQCNFDVKHDLKECRVYIKEDNKDSIKKDLDHDLTKVIFLHCFSY